MMGVRSNLSLKIAFSLLLLALLARFGLYISPVRNIVAQSPGWFAFGLGVLALGVTAALLISYTILKDSQISQREKWARQLSNWFELSFLRGAHDSIIVDKGECKPAGSKQGKGNVIVRHGSAALLQKAGIPGRMLASGKHRLEAKESVHTAIDLTLQIEDREEIVYTKDGIPLGAKIRVHFQIQPGGDTPSKQNMYPVTEGTLHRAVFSVRNWKEHTLETAVAILRAVVASRYLSQIFDATEEHVQDGRRTDLAHLQDELKHQLAGRVFEWGVKICELCIALTPPKELAQESIASERLRSENRRIEEFLRTTGGSVSDYALIQLSEAISRAGGVPPAVERALSRVAGKPG